MFFHEDLSFYTNKSFRSYEFLDNIWNEIENDLIYSIGLLDTGNITLIIDPGLIFLTVTSNFIQVYDKKYQTNFNHSLDFCEYFTIEIEIQIINSEQFFYIENRFCNLYFQVDKILDEGIIEYSTITNLNVQNIYKFKNIFFLTLVKEIQYAINKNIFHLDIHKVDSIKSELDSDYEILRTYKYLNKLSFNETISQIKKENLIFTQNIKLLIQLESMIKKIENLKKCKL